jgi:para-nitrobenzyl esterase
MPALRPTYEADGALTDAELLRRVQTDFIFTSASMGMASLAARSAPAWSYHFSYVPVANRATMPGAPHCADMPYMIGLPDDAPPADQAIARKIQSYWYDFIARGDPNGPGLTTWPRTVPGTIEPLVMADTFRAARDFEGARMRLWFAKWRAENKLSTLP